MSNKYIIKINTTTQKTITPLPHVDGLPFNAEEYRIRIDSYATTFREERDFYEPMVYLDTTGKTEWNTTRNNREGVCVAMFCVNIIDGEIRTTTLNRSVEGLTELEFIFSIEKIAEATNKTIVIRDSYLKANIDGITIKVDRTTTPENDTVIITALVGGTLGWVTEAILVPRDECLSESIINEGVVRVSELANRDMAEHLKLALDINRAMFRGTEEEFMEFYRHIYCYKAD